MTFLLDTDTVSFALRGVGRVGKRLLSHRPSEIAVSTMTVAELRYGASLRGSRKLHGLIDDLLTGLSVVPFGADAAAHYGVLAASLRRAGAPIGMADTLIAAHALALGVTLVTHNTKHFRRVGGLDLVDWY